MAIGDIKGVVRALEGRLSVDLDDLPQDVRRSVAGIAAGVEPTSLDSGDLFRLLAGNAPQDLKAHERLIRRALDMPEEDLASVRLSFSTLRLKSGGQVAITRITPEKIDKTRPPIVFAGGFAHKTAVYLSFLSELAREEGREVIAFDLPGVGNSKMARGASVNHGILYESLVRVVNSLTDYKNVVVMGHSLGTFPIRHLYFHEGDVNKKIDQFVMITPLPAEAERRAGYHINEKFMYAELPHLPFGASGIPARPVSVFFQNHPPDEFEWMKKVVDKERFPVNISGFIGALWAADEEPMLGVLGKDPRLTWVMVRGDDIVRCSNPDKWSGRNGVAFINDPDADHGIAAGIEYPRKYVGVVRDVLGGKYNKGPRLDMPLLQRGVDFRGGIEALGSTAGLGLAGPIGFARFKLPGVYFNIGASLMVGGGDGRLHLPLSSFAEVEVNPRQNGHLSVVAGVNEGVDLRRGEREPISVYAGLNYDLWFARAFARMVAGEAGRIDGVFGLTFFFPK